MNARKYIQMHKNVSLYNSELPENWPLLKKITTKAFWIKTAIVQVRTENCNHRSTVHRVDYTQATIIWAKPRTFWQFHWPLLSRFIRNLSRDNCLDQIMQTSELAPPLSIFGQIYCVWRGFTTNSLSLTHTHTHSLSLTLTHSCTHSLTHTLERPACYWNMDDSCDSVCVFNSYRVWCWRREIYFHPALKLMLK